MCCGTRIPAAIIDTKGTGPSTVNSLRVVRGCDTPLPNCRSGYYGAGMPNARTRKTAIWPRVLGELGQ
jgi:hypothetical protein